MPRVTLRLSGTEVLCREEHPSLLVALEAHQVEVEYQCRSGYCGSCRCRLGAGQVDWLTEPLAFINDRGILPYPTYKTAVRRPGKAQPPPGNFSVNPSGS